MYEAMKKVARNHGNLKHSNSRCFDKPIHWKVHTCNRLLLLFYKPQPWSDCYSSFWLSFCSASFVCVTTHHEKDYGLKFCLLKAKLQPNGSILSAKQIALWQRQEEKKRLRYKQEEIAWKASESVPRISWIESSRLSGLLEAGTEPCQHWSPNRHALSCWHPFYKLEEKEEKRAKSIELNLD